MPKLGTSEYLILATGLTLIAYGIITIKRSLPKRSVIETTNDKIIRTFDDLRTHAHAVTDDHEAAEVLTRIDRIIVDWQDRQDNKNN